MMFIFGFLSGVAVLGLYAACVAASRDDDKNGRG